MVSYCKKHKNTPIEVMVFGGRSFTSCPECEREREEEERREIARKEWDFKVSKWSKGNVKPKFYSMTFEDYVPQAASQEEAKRLVMAIADGSGRSLVLCGNNGTGKTMLASLAVMKRGGYIYKMYEIIIRIKSSYKANAKEDEKDILDSLSKAPLLVIDEVGKQYGSESERNWLSYLVDERYELGLPTIMISNLKKMSLCNDKERSEGLYLEKYLGRDAVSRLSETADILWIDCEDFRRKGIDKNM